MVSTKLSPYEFLEPPQGSQKFTRRLHELLPNSFQNNLRDKYLGSFFDRVVSASAIPLAIRYPRALARFLALGKSRQVFQYGHESKDQTVEIYRCGNEGAPLVVFVHGGAWFSGRPWMYRLIANALLRQGMDLAVVGYTTYRTLDETNRAVAAAEKETHGEFAIEPALVMGHVDHQVDDLQHCLEFLMGDPRSPYAGEGGANVPVFLSGHSSGAHICSLLLLRQALGTPGHDTLPRPVAGFIGLSGVFDIVAHHDYEARRGVHEISGMAPSNGGILAFHRNSPTFLAAMLTKEQAATLPPFLVVHGDADDTVPFTNSVVFAETLVGHGGQVKSAWLSGVDHQGTVASLMLEVNSETEKKIAAFVEVEAAAAAATAGAGGGGIRARL